MSYDLQPAVGRTYGQGWLLDGNGLRFRRELMVWAWWSVYVRMDVHETLLRRGMNEWSGESRGEFSPSTFIPLFMPNSYLCTP